MCAIISFYARPFRLFPRQHSDGKKSYSKERAGKSAQCTHLDGFYPVWFKLEPYGLKTVRLWYFENDPETEKMKAAEMEKAIVAICGSN